MYIRYTFTEIHDILFYCFFSSRIRLYNLFILYANASRLSLCSVFTIPLLFLVLHKIVLWIFQMTLLHMVFSWILLYILIFPFWRTLLFLIFHHFLWWSYVFVFQLNKNLGECSVYIHNNCCRVSLFCLICWNLNFLQCIIYRSTLVVLWTHK